MAAKVPRFKKGDVIVPRGKLKPILWNQWALVVDSQEKDGTLHAYPMGGGFEKRIPPSAVLSRDFVVVPEEMRENPEYYLATFTAEFVEGMEFRAWTDGGNWNGWGIPLFEFDEAMRLNEIEQRLEGVRSAYYDEARRAFVVEFVNADEPEVFGEERIVVDGREISVWGVGAGSWTWDYPRGGPSEE